MGLSPNELLSLIALRKAGHLADGARVVEIGAQQLSSAFLRSDTELTELAGLFGRPAADLGKPQNLEHPAGLEAQPHDAPSSRPFWQSLGLNYAAIDFGGHRDSISLDLNRQRVPWRLRSTFDLVVNAGTTEHVANQDNAFRVIHDLVKPGGIMMHTVPAGGMLTHGLVAYNMQFFWLLCRENEYEVIDLFIQFDGLFSVSPDVAASNAEFGHFQHQRPLPCTLQVPVLTIRAVLRKCDDRDYATMLDLPADALPLKQ